MSYLGKTKGQVISVVFLGENMNTEGWVISMVLK